MMERRKCRLFLLLFCITLSSAVAEFAANEYEYSVKRDGLLSEAEEYSGRQQALNEDEQVVDHFLCHLKVAEFAASRDAFPGQRPIEEVMDVIRGTELYGHLKTLPKGGNMHTHENHQLSKRLLLELVFSSADFEHLYILPADHPTRPWTLDFFLKPPEDEGWLRVQDVQDSGYRLEQILEQQTLIGVMDDAVRARPTDSDLRWKTMNPLWGRCTVQIIANLNIKRQYLLALWRTSLAEGVTYLETRKNMGDAEALYVLDPAAGATHGKRYLDTDDRDMDVQVAREVFANLSASHPEMIGHRRVVYNTRGESREAVREAMERVARMRDKYPDHILGFDLVAQEDAGNSLLYFLDPLLRPMDPLSRPHDPLSRPLGTSSRLPLYLHNAETNWPEDLLTSNDDADPVGTLENAYDAILLGVKRIGHGLGFIKHPFLLKLLKEREIAIEACPVSNQILGYVADIRNHPAMHYYRSGVPVVLGGDDQGTFGVDDFTLDWFHVFTSWGLGLQDLKQLAENSLRYSGMSQEEQEEAVVNKWLPSWNKYIAEKKAYACDYNYTEEEPIFGMLLPKSGPLSVSTQIHVYGRHFQQAICMTVYCRFGDLDPTRGRYVDQNHLICDTPAVEGDEEELELKVSLDSGKSYHNHPTKFTFYQRSASSFTSASLLTVLLSLVLQQSW